MIIVASSSPRHKVKQHPKKKKESENHQLEMVITNATISDCVIRCCLFSFVEKLVKYAFIVYL